MYSWEPSRAIAHQTLGREGMANAQNILGVQYIFYQSCHFSTWKSAVPQFPHIKRTINPWDYCEDRLRGKAWDHLVPSTDKLYDYCGQSYQHHHIFALLCNYPC